MSNFFTGNVAAYESAHWKDIAKFPNQFRKLGFLLAGSDNISNERALSIGH